MPITIDSVVWISEILKYRSGGDYTKFTDIPRGGDPGGTAQYHTVRQGNWVRPYTGRDG
jgi:hypothetical protein